MVSTFLTVSIATHVTCFPQNSTSDDVVMVHCVCVCESMGIAAWKKIVEKSRNNEAYYMTQGPQVFCSPGVWCSPPFVLGVIWPYTVCSIIYMWVKIPIPNTCA